MYNENGDNMERGFTLAELLGVTVLLALVMALGYPVLFGIFEEKEGQIDEAKRELITSSAINYAKKNLNDYPYKEGQSACIFLKTLVDENVIGYEVEEELYDRIVQIKMNVNNKYTADILEKGKTCTSYGTNTYKVETCTKDASTASYTIKDYRTLYYKDNTIIKQVHLIEGKNNSELSSFEVQANNYETLSNTLKYHEGIYTQMNKGEAYFKMRVEFDMSTFTEFNSEEIEALENAPIFYSNSALENVCS